MDVPAGDAIGHTDSNSALSTRGLIALLNQYPALPLEINNVQRGNGKPFSLDRVLVVGIDAEGGEAERADDAVKVRLYPVY